jgi:ABC-type protease/lipase transport system fused ATPase/permease subunit
MINNPKRSGILKVTLTSIFVVDRFLGHVWLVLVGVFGLLVCIVCMVTADACKEQLASVSPAVGLRDKQR